MRTSVILPAYNAAEFIEPALDSLLRQTEPDSELIVVDDGSSDRTSAIVSGISQRVNLIRGEHRGLVAALNAGIAASTCDYIARMDADDLAHPDRLRRQADYLDGRPGVGLVASQAEYLGDRNQNRALALWVDWTNSLLAAEEISLNRFVESPLVHPTVMFRRELIERFGGYREGPFPEDYELWLRWLEAGVKMAKLPDKLLSWREREDRLTRTDPRYSPEAFYACKAPYLARWLERHNPHHPRVIVWGAGRGLAAKTSPTPPSRGRGPSLRRHRPQEDRLVHLGRCSYLARRIAAAGRVLRPAMGRQTRRPRAHPAGARDAGLSVG